MQIVIGGRQQSPKQIVTVSGLSIKEAALLAAISSDKEAGLIARGLLAIQEMFLSPIKVLGVGATLHLDNTEKQNVDAILSVNGTIVCFEIKRIAENHKTKNVKEKKLCNQAEHGRQMFLESGIKAQKLMAAVDGETMRVSINNEVWYKLACPKVNFTSLIQTTSVKVCP
jgi:hypothetical protein